MIAARLRWSLGRPHRARLAGSLREVSHKLEGLAHSTERDFLAVGGKLEDIVKRARAESGTLASLGGDMGGERGDALTGALDGALKWAKNARQASGSGTAFRELAAAVQAVNAPLADLKNAVRTLRVMGVVAGIESARLGARAAGFAALAGEVGSLAAAIDGKSDAILDTGAVLGRLLDETRARAETLDREQTSGLLLTVTRSAEGFEVLRAERERIAQASRDAQAGYGKVAAGIAGVVEALQFHDATRQRLEHVSAELTQLAAGLDAGMAGGAAAVSAQAVRLQAAQLAEAAQSFQTCVGGIQDDLAQLAATVGEFARLARDLLGSAGEADQSLAGGVEGCTAAIGRAIAEWTASRSALAAAAGTVSEACTRMSSFISEIEGVGIRMLWLALNAEIQAVQLAESGAVMGAVAKGIRGVAQDASTNAAAVSAVLRDVEARAGRLSAEFGGGEAASRDAESVATRIREVDADLRSWGAESGRVLAAIAAGGDALSHEIASLGESITAHQDMASVSSACLDSLEEAASSAILASGDRTQAVHAARKSYTMHAEREVHDSFTGAAPAPEDAPAGSSEPAPEAVLASAPGSEFGDNVDLF